MREIVSAYAKDELADDLIYEALADAGLAALPERADDLREFAAVELRHAVASALGPDAADAVVTGLEPMLDVLSRMDQRASDQKRSVPPPRGEADGARFRSEAPRSGPAKVARVAIITDDARLAVRVRVALGAGQDLARYRSLEELGQRGRIHASIVVDCRPLGGAAGLITSANDARDAIGRTDVLLLFAGVSERSALRRACPSAGVIVCSSRDVDDTELADLLATFVGTK